MISEKDFLAKESHGQLTTTIQPWDLFTWEKEIWRTYGSQHGQVNLIWSLPQILKTDHLWENRAKYGRMLKNLYEYKERKCKKAEIVFSMQRNELLLHT